MSKRFLECTPSELTKLAKQDLLNGIRVAEGRVVCAYVCPRAASYIEKVSNLELAASFGADMINIEGLDPKKLQMCGLPSKNSSDDQKYKTELQLEMGFGWTVNEFRDLVGRPIGLILLVPDYEGQQISGLYGDAVYSREMMEYISNEGYHFVSLCGFNHDALLNAVREANEIAGETMVIEAGIPHGPGSIDGDFPPYNLREVTTPEFVKNLANAGADIIDIPAVGVTPGFTMEYVTALVDAIHEGKSLAASCVAHSIEGADDNTLRRIAIDNKVCGVDMYNVAAGGVYEAVTLPESLQAFCIAVKGRRHTYRRMCQSPKR